MLILTHIGNNIPNYIDTFIEQFKKFNSDYNIVFLVNQTNCDHHFFKKHNIETYPIELLFNDRIDKFLKNFCGKNLTFFKNNIEYGGDEYWCVTAVRLFFVYEYCIKKNLSSFFYFENDIMIYEKLEKLEKIIKLNPSYKDKILITRVNEYLNITSFMYVDNVDIYNHMLNEICQYSEKKINFQSYGIDFLNEMGLLHIYQTLNGDKMLNLPVSIKQKSFSQYEYFQSIFDPATYGQFLDGIPSQPGISILPSNHSLYEELVMCKNFKIYFKNEGNLKVPFILYEGIECKINSLHIHSKRLELFLS